MSMEMTVVAKGTTEQNKALSIGDKAIYLGHLPGGMVAVKLADGSNDKAHPLCFKELR